jgi:hypothetical protein
MEKLKAALKDAGLNVSDAEVQADLTDEMVAIVVADFKNSKAGQALAKSEPKTAIEKRGKSKGKKELIVAQDVPVSAENPFLLGVTQLAGIAQESEDRTTNYQQALGEIFTREVGIYDRLNGQFYEALSAVDQARASQSAARSAETKVAQKEAISQILGGLSE